MAEQSPLSATEEQRTALSTGGWRAHGEAAPFVFGMIAATPPDNARVDTAAHAAVDNPVTATYPGERKDYYDGAWSGGCAT